MIGNDIIDLELAATQSNWQRKGFINKIFTEYEKGLIFSSNTPFKIVWLLWSMKESAYKVYTQKYKKRFFAPKKFECQLISKTEGAVLIESKAYKTKSTINSKSIFTETILNSNHTIISNYFDIDNSTYTYQSKTVQEKLKSVISKKMDIPITELRIKKNSNSIPQLYQNNKQLEILFSLSHHGNYGAYSILNAL